MTQTKAPQLTFRVLGQHCSESWSTVREVGLEGKLHLQESKGSGMNIGTGGSEDNTHLSLLSALETHCVLTQQNVSSNIL